MVSYTSLLVGRPSCLYFKLKLSLQTVWYMKVVGNTHQLRQRPHRWEKAILFLYENTSACMTSGLWFLSLGLVKMTHGWKVLTVIFIKCPWTITEKLFCVLPPFKVVTFTLFRCLMKWSITSCSNCGFLWPRYPLYVKQVYMWWFTGLVIFIDAAQLKWLMSVAYQKDIYLLWGMTVEKLCFSSVWTLKKFWIWGWQL